MELLPKKLTQRTLKRKHYACKGELIIAHDIATEFNCDVFLSNAKYQIAKIKGDGVQLVLYPHKTTAGNHHIRIRDENSKDPKKALAIADALDKTAGFNCTFQMKLEARNSLAQRIR